MISFKHTSLKDFMKNQSPTNPTKEVIENFKAEIELFLQKALIQDDEEFQKNEINKFLAKVYGYDCNTKGKVDSAIYVEGEAQVLIEAKSLKNKTEFPKKDAPLSKALYESILYFLREIQHNNSIKHIILANPHEFYIFDADKFEILFLKDKKIKKFYENCDGKEGTDKSTKKFFEEVEKHLKGGFDGELPYTHFCLSDKLSTQELTAIYQLLSPQVLLKVRKTLDANTLNKGFYEELLYILGLQEVGEKSGGKIIITPSSTPHTFSSEILRHYGLDKEATFTLITTWNNRILFLRLLESMLKSFGHIQKEFLDTSIIKDFKTLQTLFFEVLAKKVQERSPSLIPEFASIPYLNSSLFDRIALEREGKSIGGLYPSSLQLFSRSILRKDPRFKDRESLPLLEYLFEFLHAYDFTTTPKDISQGVKQNHDKLINSAVLGLVFEKLNGYKEGSFYTPSFITSYMCKESITQATLEKFNSTFGWKCESLQKLKEKIEKEEKISDEEFLNTLLSLKICDPSVGSGHFLVSALNEIVLIAHTLRIISLPRGTSLELENDEILIRDREGLFSYCKPTKQDEDEHIIQTKMFNLKKSIIENCLFGVDINPNSCEITKLRLWIELLKYSYYIFDENGKNTNALETLPNIDINIKCGNSLISYFGLHDSFSHIRNIKEQITNYKHLVKCYKEGIYESKSKIDEQISRLLQSFKNFCFSQKYESEIKTFSKLCEKYSQNYGDYLANEDSELSRYVHAGLDLDLNIDEEKAKGDFQALKDAYRKIFSLEENKPFEWRFAFPEVLDEEGEFRGFDCVIGNPPYIRQELIKDLKPTLAKKYEIYKGTSDIYTYFFERGFHIARGGGGILTFITSNKWTRAGYGEALRKFILEKTTLQSYIDFNGEQVFESATVDTSITTFLKLPPTPSHQVAYLSCADSSTLSSSKPDSIPQSSLSTQTLTFSSSSAMALKEKIESIGTPLKEWDITINYGIKTGYNEAFIITTEKREEILRNCKTQEEKEATEQIIKKMLRGKDIKRYSYEWADLWLINTHNGYKDSEGNKILPIDIEEYPALKAHLDEMGKNHKGKGKGLYDRDDQGITPYNLRNCAYLEEFEKEKIIWAEMTKKSCFTFDKNQTMVNQTCYFFNHQSNKYLLGILNSKIIFYYMGQIASSLGEGAFRWIKQYVEKLPIPKITEINQSTADKIIALVERILEQKEQNPKADTSAQESEIDKLVYTLYNLTDEEIKIIENKN